MADYARVRLSKISNGIVAITTTYCILPMPRLNGKILVTRSHRPNPNSRGVVANATMNRTKETQRWAFMPWKDRSYRIERRDKVETASRRFWSIVG